MGLRGRECQKLNPREPLDGMTEGTMCLTNQQKKANELFFDKMNKMLNNNGIWMGDDGFMKKCGTGWTVDITFYTKLKSMVTSQWLETNVIRMTAA
jgi:hypothetical protein